jgi:hypothetical protein
LVNTQIPFLSKALKERKEERKEENADLVISQ